MRRPRQELIEKGVLKEISENGTAASLIIDSLIAKLFYRFKIREFPVSSVNNFTLRLLQQSLTGRTEDTKYMKHKWCKK